MAGSHQEVVPVAIKTERTTLDEFGGDHEAEPTQDVPADENRCVAMAVDTGARCENRRTGGLAVCGMHLHSVNEVTLIDDHEPSDLLTQLVTLAGETHG